MSKFFGGGSKKRTTSKEPSTISTSISEPNPSSSLLNVRPVGDGRTSSMVNIRSAVMDSRLSSISQESNESEELTMARKKINQLESENNQLYQDLMHARKAATEGCSAHAEIIERLQNEIDQLKQAEVRRAGLLSPSLSSPNVMSPSLSPKMTIEDFVSAPAAKLISINIESNNISLRTSILNTWTVRETIQKMKKKIPGDTTNYHLLIRPTDSKGSYVVMENDRLVDYYKGLEEVRDLQRCRDEKLKLILRRYWNSKSWACTR